ncbi:M43 family zinc metalloprotease [Aquimarina pacifica]|uniref:M43 family zinc metalloprotease n=1 Tax=Aquimarina pacifica TaxID=1296415 RepID=UPI000684BB63|nr:M43 family zinc metalloprotease [Aquimarina pacifica]
MKNKSSIGIILLSLYLMLLGCESEIKNETRCGFDEYVENKLTTNEDFRNNVAKVEELIQQYQSTILQGADGLRGGRIVIPVVVHVLHNGEDVGVGTNISDAQIQSQIDVMNRDFRKLNVDISGVPSDFSGITADSRIEFQLARRDPDCNPTNGITRQRAGRTSFSFVDDDAKTTSTGGRDSWDTEKYLNMWTVGSLRVELGIDPIGYSSFPNAPEFVDAGLGVDDDLQGFVCESNTFGNIGSVPSTSPFNDGRTGVHEFGHFFGLWHIWRQPGCSNSDEVDDTPNQDNSYSGTPTHPQNSCDSDDMFMNYMDYVNDSAMLAFTKDQVDRMVGSLYTTRATLIGSDGLLPPPDDSAGADIFIQDTPEDVGNEPNNESDKFYVSEDIWIRNSSGIINQEHENPLYSSTGTWYVYVRVRNKGCASSTDTNVELYWAKASSGLSWTSPWDGSVSIDGAAMGGQIGTQPTGVIQGGGYTILEYEWTNIPNPDDYVSFGADKTHFCLLARAESGITFPETTSLGENVKNNNNIAWKNIDIAVPGDGGRESTIMVGNYERDREYEMTLVFEDANEIEASVFEYGEVFIALHPELLKKWTDGGEKGTGVLKISDSIIKIDQPGARLEGILLDPLDIYACTIMFKETQPMPGPKVYFMDVEQYEGSTSVNKKIGGQRILVKVWNQK